MKLNRIKLIVLVLGYSLATALAQTNSLNLPAIVGGPFRPEWNSLPDYQSAPKWFRDAKFGLWTHWGPQCQPEQGYWYARSMYQEGGGDYMSPLKEYGHPSTNGFKDMIHAWTRYEVAEGADKTGSLADVPYDRKLTKADGKVSGGMASICRLFMCKTTPAEIRADGDGGIGTPLGAPQSRMPPMKLVCKLCCRKKFNGQTPFVVKIRS